MCEKGERQNQVTKTGARSKEQGAQSMEPETLNLKLLTNKLYLLSLPQS